MQATWVMLMFALMLSTPVSADGSIIRERFANLFGLWEVSGISNGCPILGEEIENVTTEAARTLSIPLEVEEIRHNALLTVQATCLGDAYMVIATLNRGGVILGTQEPIPVIVWHHAYVVSGRPSASHIRGIARKLVRDLARVMRGADGSEL